LFGEALAASLAVSLKLKNFIMEGNSLVVVMALQHPSIMQNWKIADRINDYISIIHLPLLGRHERLIEVQTSAPTMWLIELQLKFTLAAFPLIFIPLFFLICSGKDPPP
jgi:hypothetical protein